MMKTLVYKDLRTKKEEYEQLHKNKTKYTILNYNSADNEQGHIKRES